MTSADELQPPPVGLRRWLFRLVSLTAVPVLLLILLEAGLRIVGYGYSSKFFVPIPSTDAVTTNPRYGYLFFPQAVARSPVFTRLARDKPAGTVRLFVLGGSAALGTPEPAFSFGRILEVMLSEMYPSVRFEVVNAAMTATNSHVARRIAAEFGRYEPDLVLVYVGNNEVVGPFGPGTAFRGTTLSLGLARAGVAVRSLRLGQLLASVANSWLPEGEQPARWRGMQMFLDKRVAADDPRLERVYRQYRSNLEDIIAVTRDTGARVLLSTVASNEADNPPFASSHRSGLSETERQRFAEFMERSATLIANDRADDAVRVLAEALAMDDGHAEAHWLLGRAFLDAGDVGRAREHLVRARDLDALRFRADSRLNAVVREVAAGGGPGVVLVDGERALAAAPETAAGILGDGLLYEHAHFRFAGNYRLAEAFVPHVTALLPAAVREGNSTDVPSPQRCAELLAYTDWDRWVMARFIRETTDRPPFTNQVGHAESARRRADEEARLRAAFQASPEPSVRAHRIALAARPHDLVLAQKLGDLLVELERFPEAVVVWRELVEAIPVVADWHRQLSVALNRTGDAEGALSEVQSVVQLVPESVVAHTILARMLRRTGAVEAARVQLDEALRRNPRHIPARIQLAELHAERGDVAAARAAYEAAIAADPDAAEAVIGFAKLQLQHGDGEAARDLYRRAVTIDPARASTHFALADLLLEQGRAGEAAESYEHGLALEPGRKAARLNLARARMRALRSDGRKPVATAPSQSTDR